MTTQTPKGMIEAKTPDTPMPLWYDILRKGSDLYDDVWFFKL